MRRAAAELLTRPILYWALAVIFGLRVLVLSIINSSRPDAEGMWEGAHAYLTNPAHMYDAAALACAHVCKDRREVHRHKPEDRSGDGVPSRHHPVEDEQAGQ